jgi:anti-sigma factor RsiW
MFRCKDIAERASAYVSREMSPWERVRYHLHLFICHDCRNFIAQFRATLGALRGRKSPADPAVVEQQVATLLRARRDDQPH